MNRLIATLLEIKKSFQEFWKQIDVVQKGNVLPDTISDSTGLLWILCDFVCWLPLLLLSMLYSERERSKGTRSGAF